MHTIICSRSGLTFEWETKRKKIHPEISGWTSHKDWETRRIAIEVIDRGKNEGWSTIKKFQAEISAALRSHFNPDPDPTPDHFYDFEGAWVAKILGYSEQYDYERDFVDRHEKINDLRSQYYIAEDGIFETCYKSRKGNQTRNFIKIENGEVQEISKEEIDQLLGDRPQLPSEELFSFSFLSPTWSGKDLTHLQVGDTYFENEKAYTIVTRNREWIYEDGMSFGLSDDEGERVFGKSRLATSEESLSLEKKMLREQAIATLRNDWTKTKRELIKTLREKGDRPPHDAGERLVDYANIYGRGDWFEVTTTEIWYCQNNGGDGDDWGRNNVKTWGAGAIGWRIPFDQAIASKIQKIHDILASNFEVPEQFTLQELKAGTKKYLEGGNVNPELVFQAQQAGYISTSEAMNSDF